MTQLALIDLSLYAHLYLVSSPARCKVYITVCELYSDNGENASIVAENSTFQRLVLALSHHSKWAMCALQA